MLDDSFAFFVTHLSNWLKLSTSKVDSCLLLHAWRHWDWTGAWMFLLTAFFMLNSIRFEFLEVKSEPSYPVVEKLVLLRRRRNELVRWDQKDWACLQIVQHAR